MHPCVTALKPMRARLGACTACMGGLCSPHSLPVWATSVVVTRLEPHGSEEASVRALTEPLQNWLYPQLTQSLVPLSYLNPAAHPDGGRACAWQC